MALQATASDQPGLRGQLAARRADRGQVLVLFVLFLLVLLGASAIAIDYANWLLTDRRLQNVADHVALAGSSVFGQRDPNEVFNCGSGKCPEAREQAWTAFNQELSLGLSDSQITCLASEDTSQAGWTSTHNADVTCGSNVEFHHTLWVSTPPPGNSSYTGLGGMYPRQYGIVFARIDEPTRSFLGAVFGIVPSDRIGWATAGTAPTAFALEVFCRDQIAPQSGVCVNSAGLTIDGQGGIRLKRGDIGGNESLVVSANTGSGVIVENGQVFLVHNLPCGPSTYNCGEYPANTGGIADADPTTDSAPDWAVGQTALHIPPLPVPHYPSPVDGTVDHTVDCNAVDTTPCVPYRPDTSTTRPGDWTCGTPTSTDPYCGVPTVTSGNVVCGVNPAEATDPTADNKPPMIPPGYYHSIEVPADSCAILDPTAENSGGLLPYQLPGIYEFKGQKYSGKAGKIELHDNSYLIGDGVTLVFDSDWPDPTGNAGIVLPPNSALVLNTYTRGGSNPPCTASTEGPDVNMSGAWWDSVSPASDILPYSAVCAAWEVDPDSLAGQNAWSVCTDATSCDAYDRDSYDPQAGYRGITFYFIPKGNAWPPTGILGRFQMQGSSGSYPGIAFRGVMYAPYDDVQMTGGNGFNTVGQVLSWSAKFNGGSSYIDLDYPYDYPPGDPFLLEPTVGQ